MDDTETNFKLVRLLIIAVAITVVSAYGLFHGEDYEEDPRKDWTFTCVVCGEPLQTFANRASGAGKHWHGSVCERCYLSGV